MQARDGCCVTLQAGSHGIGVPRFSYCLAFILLTPTNVHLTRVRSPCAAGAKRRAGREAIPMNLRTQPTGGTQELTGRPQHIVGVWGHA